MNTAQSEPSQSASRAFCAPNSAISCAERLGAEGSRAGQARERARAHALSRGAVPRGTLPRPSVRLRQGSEHARTSRWGRAQGGQNLLCENGDHRQPRRAPGLKAPLHLVDKASRSVEASTEVFSPLPHVVSVQKQKEMFFGFAFDPSGRLPSRGWPRHDMLFEQVSASDVERHIPGATLGESEQSPA